MYRRPFRRVTFRLKLLRENENFVAHAICFQFKKSLENCKFPNYLKLTNTRQFSNKANVRIDQLVFSLFFQSYLKVYLVDNFHSSLIIYSLNFNVVLERIMELNNA